MSSSSWTASNFALMSASRSASFSSMASSRDATAAFFVCSVILPPSRRSFSILWKPVHSWPSSRSASRRSMRGSRSSGKDSAIGSMRSQ
nr:hypothetical protein [Corynebacterium variabile]